MCEILSILKYEDDVEILDYGYNLRICSLQIKNQAGYKLWEGQFEFFKNSLFQQNLEFGSKPQQINIQKQRKQQQVELIIYDGKIILKNKDKDQIFYQLFERQQVKMENVQKINQYTVNYDKNKQIIQFSDGLNQVKSIQLTENKQSLIINGVNLGVVIEQSDQSIQYQGNNLCVLCGIKQNEEIELKNFQNFQIGINQFSIEYQFK